MDTHQQLSAFTRTCIGVAVACRYDEVACRERRATSFAAKQHHKSASHRSIASLHCTALHRIAAASHPWQLHNFRRFTILGSFTVSQSWQLRPLESFADLQCLQLCIATLTASQSRNLATLSFAALQYRQCSFAVTMQFASLQLRRFAFLQFCSLAVLQFCSFAAFELFALFTVFASFAWFTVSLLCSISQE